MMDRPNTIRRSNRLQTPSRRIDIYKIWLILRWPLYIIVGFFILYFISYPLRARGSNGYVLRGDNFLEQKKYLSAEVEYKKALILKNNKTASKRIELSVRAQKNVLELEPFYAEKNNRTQIGLFNKINEVPANPKEAIVFSKDLLNDGEYQLAIVAAQTALQMDPGYDIAKEYFKIAKKETARFLQLSPEAQQFYDN